MVKAEWRTQAGELQEKAVEKWSKESPKLRKKTAEGVYHGERIQGMKDVGGGE
jgi:hypothetical protein